jgi:hypothetical protein
MIDFKKIFLETKEYYIKMIALFVFWKLIKLHPNFKKYKKETAFSVYRSLLCIFFLLYALENFINNFSDLFTNPFTKRECYDDITNWFIVYLIFDILKMIHYKNKRIDLYLHHIWCLTSVIISKSSGVCHSLYNLPLIAEAISVVSGVDSMAMEDGNMKESYYYKLYRRNIIRYVRLPLWIILFLLVLRNTHKIPQIVWYNCILSAFVMLGLDRYWEKKCDKVVKKYKNENLNPTETKIKSNNI